MGHLVFIALHLVAVFYAPVLLVLTIPLHLIYGAVSKGSVSGDPEEVHCPDCRELVRWDATVCKHCHAKLVPVLRGSQ